jgi:hypothetical protein
VLKYTPYFCFPAESFHAGSARQAVQLLLSAGFYFDLKGW